MHKTLMVAGSLAALALPAAAQAHGSAKHADRAQAVSECRAERGTTAATREAFAQKYGTGKKQRNAFGQCVKATTAQERAQRRAAKADAVDACRAERGDTAEAQAAFADKYGTDANKKNAFGKCVSSKAKVLKAQQDAQDQADATAEKTAAATCDQERGDDDASEAAFEDKYGTNANKRNAFGQCVEQHADDHGDGDQGDDDAQSGDDSSPSQDAGQSGQAGDHGKPVGKPSDG